MNEKEKIERIIEILKQDVVDDDMPVCVGSLNKSQGLNGFHLAEVGHPVFKLKDRYIIYLDSKSPLMISEHGKQTTVKEFKVAVPYYIDTLAPFIDLS